APEAATLHDALARGLASHAVVTCDHDERIVSWNSGAESILGYPASEAIGRRLAELPIEPPEPCDRAILLAQAAEKKHVMIDGWWTRPDGTRFWGDGSVHALEDGRGELIGYGLILRDLTQRATMEEALRESEARFRLLVEGSSHVFFYMQDIEHRLTYLSPSVEQVTGYRPDELVGQPFDLLLTGDPSDVDVHDLMERETIDGTTPFPYTAIIRHRAGHRITLELIEEPVARGGMVVGVQGFARDITRERELEQRLVHDAMHDRLTALPNRARFVDRLAHTAILARRRPEHLFAVLLIDLDRFKLVNDSLGHLAGDQLLVSVARRLLRSVRPGDTVTRLGGDEFAVLLDEISDVRDATLVADRIEQELRAPFSIGAHEVFTTASIGIALSASGWETPEDLVRNADLALYRAKARGKARYEVFDQVLHATTVARLRLETDMRRAAEREEFRVLYMPIVSLATGRIIAFEALSRWMHPSRGIVEPAEFIPVAEEMGLILALDRWVLTKACRQLRAWKDSLRDLLPSDNLAISVNLSGRHFSQMSLADDIARTIDQAGIRPEDVKLEITESVLVERGEAAARIMDQLRDLGILLQIDDFGTGYSSLGSLHQLAVDALKIDRSFVHPEQVNEEIVRAIVNMAHSLRLAVVAEGVETADQLGLLRELDCDYAQGFLFSPPIDATAATVMLTEGPRW
ncbi:MAG TPA: EAL domain-containing protein, partial [Gemmatimonadaceae bacterium]|nr:EAL domain-containing protein [Gemmatimonadaceae bacterium]